MESGNGKGKSVLSLVVVERKGPGNITLHVKANVFNLCMLGVVLCVFSPSYIEPLVSC